MNPTSTVMLGNGYMLIHYYDDDKIGYICDITNRKGTKMITFPSRRDDSWQKIRKEAMAYARKNSLEDLLLVLKEARVR